MNQEAFVVDFAEILEVDPSEINSEFFLTKDNWDSLSIVATIVLIDEQFGFTIEGELLAGCQTFGNLWELIRNKIK